MTLFFFLLFAPPLGRTLSPAFARLNIQKKKEQTNKRQAHSKNVGKELELSLIPFRFPVCFTINIISLTHPPITQKNGKIINIMRPFYLYADKKYKTSDITTVPLNNCILSIAVQICFLNFSFLFLHFDVYFL